MITEFTRYHIPSGREAAFEQAYTEAQKYLAASPYCRSYALLRCVEEPGHYVLRIDWTSIDEHLKGFRRSADFPKFFAAVKPFVDHIQEMQHYEPTGIASSSATGGAS